MINFMDRWKQFYDEDPSKAYAFAMLSGGGSGQGFFQNQLLMRDYMGRKQGITDPDQLQNSWSNYINQNDFGGNGMNSAIMRFANDPTRASWYTGLNSDLSARSGAYTPNALDLMNRGGGPSLGKMGYNGNQNLSYTPQGQGLINRNTPFNNNGLGAIYNNQGVMVTNRSPTAISHGLPNMNRNNTGGGGIQAANNPTIPNGQGQGRNYNQTLPNMYRYASPFVSSFRGIRPN